MNESTETAVEAKPIFREDSVYHRIYTTLERTEGQPTTRKQIIARLKKNGCKESEIKLMYGLNVILSVLENGNSHRRLNKKAINAYYIEKRNDGIIVFHRR